MVTRSSFAPALDGLECALSGKDLTRLPRPLKQSYWSTTGLPLLQDPDCRERVQAGVHAVLAFYAARAAGFDDCGNSIPTVIDLNSLGNDEPRSTDWQINVPLY